MKIKNNLFFLLGIILLANIVLADSSKILGEYVAVTETELVIELALLSNNEAILTIGYLPTENVQPDLNKIEGTWRLDDDILTIEYKDYETQKYKVKSYLPYSEFGFKGGSFGLKPIIDSDSFNSGYGLWRKDAIDKLYN